MISRRAFSEYIVFLCLDQINGFPHEESTYTGDRLVSRSVVAAINNQVLSTVTFTHDALGRMTHDGTQNLDITYNYLDMPEKVSRNDTLLVKYSYLADGMKTGARSSAGEGLEYRGTMTFRRSAQGALTFESVPFAAGRMTGDGICYYVTDHLGSVRAVLDGETGNLLEASDYSAFGTQRQPQLPSLLTSQLNNSTPSMPFRHHFTGQEEQAGITSSLSLPYTDFGARHYSPSLSRWLVPDPLSEKYYDVSPYAYCANDPVNLEDSDGQCPHIVVGALGGAVVGAVINGGIALAHGQTGREFWGAVAGGAISGAITGTVAAATGGASLINGVLYNAMGGALGGFMGSAASQKISNGTIDGTLLLVDTGAGALSGALTGGIKTKIANSAQSIEANYNSSASQRAIRKEVTREAKMSGLPVAGKSTQAAIKQEVAERTSDFIATDKAINKVTWTVADKVQQSMVQLGDYKISESIYEE